MTSNEVGDQPLGFHVVQQRRRHGKVRSVLACLSCLSVICLALAIIFSLSVFVYRHHRITKTASFQPPPPDKTEVTVNLNFKVPEAINVWNRLFQLFDKFERVLEGRSKHKTQQQDETTEKPLPDRLTSRNRTQYVLPPPVCSGLNDEQKLDCQPDGLSTEASCAARRCCWAVPKAFLSNNATYNVGEVPALGIPYCFYPQNYVGYVVSKSTPLTDRVVLDLLRAQPSGFANDVQVVRVEVINYSETAVRIKIFDKNKQRFESPVPPVPDTSVTSSSSYEILTTASGDLNIKRPGTDGTALFTTNLSSLIFSDQLIQISTRLPSPVIYGLGERRGGLQRNINWQRYVFFNRDGRPDYNKNLYGSHPFYLSFERGGTSHGVFLRNSNSMEVILQPAPAATFRAIGGVLDFFVFLGPTPSQVVSQYHHLIGLPAMPPYWGLGFHLCRYGYKSLNNTRDVFERNIKAGVPIEVQWNDIDYMEKYNDFTYDKVAFDGLPKFIDELHKDGRKYVMIFDPGVSGSEPSGTYPPFDDGVLMDIFVKNITGDIAFGKVWNLVSTVFPDFTHPLAQEYWTKQFQQFHELIDFDGAWIDMNEPSNQYNGNHSGCPDSVLEKPQYVPGGETLSTNTLCMTDKHYLSNHYDVHNLYSYFEAVATYRALSAVRNKRPFVISRATSAGQGRWSGHWSGDILSDWSNLKDSISNILGFSLYGIPLMGADICGFAGDTNEELCARWQALGAFYPFSRNHNDLYSKDQDPAIMGELVINATVSTLNDRYYLLPYLYTLFYYSHTEGQTVFRPLFLEFPEDSSTYSIDKQFLWGSALLFSPALQQNQKTVLAYFPKGFWYELKSGRLLKSTGQKFALPAPYDSVNTFVRGGHIIPAQEPASTTTQGRQNSFHLIVAADDEQTAKGSLFWDDGESIDTVQTGVYNLIHFVFMNNTLITECIRTTYESEMILGKVIVFNIQDKPQAVTCNGASTSFTYDADNKVLNVQLKSSLRKPLIVQWTF